MPAADRPRSRLGLMAVLLSGLGFGGSAPSAPERRPAVARPAGPGRAAEAPDSARLRSAAHPSVHREASARRPAALGATAGLLQPRFADRRRRLPVTPLPEAFGPTLHRGERFVFDVFFAGNPSGLAEAWVEAVLPDPRGEPPRGSPTVRIEGKATTSGVVSILATVTDHMVSIVDATTGAPLENVNVVRRAGIMAPYKLRTTTIEFEGRGRVRVIDDKDGKRKQIAKEVPRDTLDPLGAMAWVRALNLVPGERAVAHVLDGNVLLRVEVVGRGPSVPDALPSIAAGLGIERGDIDLIEGTATRVDRFDVPLPDRRPYEFRAWVSNDGRGILLALDTDMWLGILRLVLARYDAPVQGRPGPAAR